MMVLPRIIAAALLLVDKFLAQWVSVSATPVNAGCYLGYTVSGNVNTCGAQFIVGVTDILEGLVAIVPTVLAALFVQGPLVP